ncbi:MAG TPA: porin family protein [Saprospiraceae bacterium]|nr:PorT family protein [Saprospiraceae bacterium]HRO07730.1 porin family protein [Saprospiraceae bacterium]HRP41044.1 porin family protein [Saprospiraceae bacterium]
MKALKSACVAMMVFGLSTLTNAQYAVGLKIGANFSDTRIGGFADNFLPSQDVYLGFTAGAIAEIPLKNGFAFRPELNFTQKGFITDIKATEVDIFGIKTSLGAKAKTRYNYLDLPLLFKYSMGNNLAKAYIIAGPTFGYAMNGHIRPVANLILQVNLPKVNLPLDGDYYQRFEVAATIGGGGEVKAGPGKIFADVRYNAGITDMLQNTIIEVSSKNQGFAITGGYAYEF